MLVEKYYNEEGEVAVLVSGDFGAGWSTWDSRGIESFLCMDKGLVELHLKGASEEEVEKYIKNKTGRDKYLGGWKDVEIEWLQQGTAFIIEEYDGAESIRTLDNLTLVA
ncbi:hypothetical protein [Haliea sp.]|uniref:hypothetical protein n=1 Tax=Haliea sp. TaxID=1932666 RepID=UPI0025C0084A|nr:hypothetical protein [Haliea sp.]|tara:strand:+ start:3148 stop:3474 length:327 start_codon:yes stop_codon:yes gene_type:complete